MVLNARPYLNQTLSLISILSGSKKESKEGTGVGFLSKSERSLDSFRLGGICMLIVKLVYISCGLWISRLRGNVRKSCVFVD